MAPTLHHAHNHQARRVSRVVVGVGEAVVVEEGGAVYAAEEKTTGPTARTQTCMQERRWLDTLLQPNAAPVAEEKRKRREGEFENDG